MDAVGVDGAGAAHLGLGVGGPARVAVHANAMPVLHKEDGAALVRIHEATTCVKPSDTTGHFWRSCFGERNVPEEGWRLTETGKEKPLSSYALVERYS